MFKSRELIKEAQKSGSKLIHGDIAGNLDLIAEWIKWLSHESEHEKARKAYFSSKSYLELSEEESVELAKYKERDHMALLFKKYAKGECSIHEYSEVYHYMGNSLEDLMLDKLTSSELKQAKDRITDLKDQSLEELSQKIKKEERLENYEKLSMVDAYVLHVLSKMNFKSTLHVLDEEIRGRVKKIDRAKPAF